ncbi:hypothetical protein ALC56_02612 [Trachymyrmex septentrionalis]|uniref:Uncharacterized protein n=1 Tax=Trachymyrmex septentrionalis TaxID=34720 RepID=A0A195FQE3_9HYME|nr:hypothetical protein ALC56_02612 [Trachymyrmex septentrionalis]
MQTSEASLDSCEVQNRSTIPVCSVCAHDVYGTVTSCRRHYDRWASISIDLSSHTRVFKIHVLHVASESELSILNVRSVGLRRHFRFMLEDTWDGHPYGEDLFRQMKTMSEDGYGTDVTSLSAFLQWTLPAL